MEQTFWDITRQLNPTTVGLGTQQQFNSTIFSLLDSLRANNSLQATLDLP